MNLRKIGGKDGWISGWGGAIAKSTYREGKFIIRVRISFQGMLPQKADGYEELK